MNNRSHMSVSKAFGAAGLILVGTECCVTFEDSVPFEIVLSVYLAITLAAVVCFCMCVASYNAGCCNVRRTSRAGRRHVARNR